LLQPRAHFRKLHVDDVAELLLRVVGNADLALVAVELDPLVVFRVLQVRRVRSHQLLPPGPNGPASAGFERSRPTSVSYRTATARRARACGGRGCRRRTPRRP